MKKKKSLLSMSKTFFLKMTFFNTFKNYKISNRFNKIWIAILLLYTSNGYSCVNCNKQLQQAISDSFYTNIAVMFSAFIVLTLIIMALAYFSLKNYSQRIDINSNTNTISPFPLVCAAMVLGIGLGGFADGIVLHQILQWHEMLSNKFPPVTLLQKSVNMFWDGIFHLFTLLSTIVGIYLLWKLFKRNHINTSGYLLSGGMLAGWGIFNLVEGIINHQILAMHNVREITPNKDYWNYGFLLFGLVLLIVGWVLMRKGHSGNNTVKTFST